MKNKYVVLNRQFVCTAPVFVLSGEEGCDKYYTLMSSSFVCDSP